MLLSQPQTWRATAERSRTCNVFCMQRWGTIRFYLKVTRIHPSDKKKILGFIRVVKNSHSDSSELRFSDLFTGVVGRTRAPKSYDGINPKPEMMICGIINHALDIHELVLIPENYAHDSSLVISIIHDHLLRHLPSATGRPTLLQLQLDNSGKDNKNWYMIAYCAVILSRWITKYKSYLM